MNKDIKLTWDTLQKGIAQAEEREACEPEIKDLKAITTLDEFLAHKTAPYWLFWYADKLDKGRIEAFEPIIATDARRSCWYCIEVAKCRIPEMEASIATDAYSIYAYCRHVAKGRIPEIEKSIATDYYCSYAYCQYVAKCKIPALEATIKKNDYYWDRYLTLPEETKQ